MKSLNKIIFQSGVAGIFALLGIASCSDDHFDVQTYGVGSTQTVWQNIESNPELDSLATILRRTRVMKEDDDNKSVLTYAQLLDQPQSFTVFAPKNGTYNAKQYLDMLDEAEHYASLGTSDGTSQALRLMYIVGNQFAGNHIARFNYESDRVDQNVRMLNSKLCVYNAGQALFNGVPLEAQGMVGASNGTLHVLEGQSPFRYNIYDFMENDFRFSSIYAYLTDSLISQENFSESMSTQGAMNENGQMVYVDSVFVTTNEVLDNSGAEIRNEDSLYIAMIPTNTAWDEALNTLRPYFSYGNRYGYDVSTTLTNYVFNQQRDFTQEEADSLFEYNAKLLLARSMFINPSTFSGIDNSDSAAVISHALTADSLISTNHEVYYNPTPGSVNPMFNPTVPERASNGYIFALEHFKTDPRYVWMTKSSFYPSSAYLSGTNVQNYQTINLTDDTRNPAVTGDLEMDMFTRYVKSGNLMNLNFRMPTSIYSGEYKVSIILVPTIIMNSYSEDEEALEEEIRFNAAIYDDQGNSLGSSNGLEASHEKVDTVVLWEKFKFDKAYAGLPDGVVSFPVLRITLPVTSRKCNALNIVGFILEPYRPDDTTTEE